jgi:hypothetical protein
MGNCCYTDNYSLSDIQKYRYWKQAVPEIQCKFDDVIIELPKDTIISIKDNNNKLLGQYKNKHYKCCIIYTNHVVKINEKYAKNAKKMDRTATIYRHHSIKPKSDANLVESKSDANLVESKSDANLIESKSDANLVESDSEPDSDKTKTTIIEPESEIDRTPTPESITNEYLYLGSTRLTFNLNAFDPITDKDVINNYNILLKDVNT